MKHFIMVLILISLQYTTNSSFAQSTFYFDFDWGLSSFTGDCIASGFVCDLKIKDPFNPNSSNTPHTFGGIVTVEKSNPKLRNPDIIIFEFNPNILGMEGKARLRGKNFDFGGGLIISKTQAKKMGLAEKEYKILRGTKDSRDPLSVICKPDAR